MAIKRLKPEEIVVRLRQVEVLMGQGMPRIDAIRQINVTEQTYYRWKKGGVRQMRTSLCLPLDARTYAEQSWRQSERAALRLILKLARE
jgi:transposase